MSTPSVDKELQERLREASAIGDIDEVRSLVESGVNINSQNEINGWTCLHWACKRNHRHVVAYLLSSGADKHILTSKDELAVQLTSKPDIRALLGDLPIIASYLSSAPYLYTNQEADGVALEPCVAQNGTLELSDNHHGDRSPGPAPTPLPEPSTLTESRPQRESALVPVAEQNGLCAVHGAPPPEPRHTPLCPAPTPVTRQQAVPQPLSCAQAGGAGGAVPAFQPFFFTSTFPVNVQELVLKVRIQNPSARENDFIEVELDRRELTYRALLRVCCRELDISADHDKDVARLQDFQELEVVVEKAESLSLLAAGGQGSLTDRPCYNMKASRLTY
ncbi:hypothetical protein JZ751_017011 [Albula glossodonta]|uniref:Ankyrin repeat domain 40 n=1 Tax=Albula glossodonta TaxID=121402 RepID=A0A8T2MK78_9TELE|nr:hypothetical protein JZ751_017011 [Albula glossodonta]